MRFYVFLNSANLDYKLKKKKLIFLMSTSVIEYFTQVTWIILIQIFCYCIEVIQSNKPKNDVKRIVSLNKVYYFEISIKLQNILFFLFFFLSRMSSTAVPVTQIYKKLKKVGKGAYGSVYKGYTKKKYYVLFHSAY